MFHVDSATGKTGKCEATIRDCPYGGPANHFTSEEAARASFENSMAGEQLRSLKKAPAKPKRKPEWPDLELYRAYIKPETEVYAHPQGKIAFVNAYGQLGVMKDGKKASTSGTVQALREGRGAWQLVKDRRTPNAPTAEEYQATFSNDVEDQKPATPAAASASRPPRRTRAPKQLTPEQNRLVAAGYPATSSLDPTKKVNFSSDIPRKAHPRDYSGYRGAASILPIGSRGNPHKLREMTAGDKLRFWNDLDPATGREKTSTVVEVWKSPEGNFKAVATGSAAKAIGSEQPFRHDQTFARMGDKWTLVGAFEPIDGGAVTGEVPDRSMPIYAYK